MSLAQIINDLSELYSLLVLGHVLDLLLILLDLLDDLGYGFEHGTR